MLVKSGGTAVTGNVTNLLDTDGPVGDQQCARFVDAHLIQILIVTFTSILFKIPAKRCFSEIDQCGDLRERNRLAKVLLGIIEDFCG